MDTNKNQSLDELIEKIVGAAYEVANVPGSGFLEKVYERALFRELVLRGLGSRAQVSFPVMYKGVTVGDCLADLVVEEQVIVELKCVDTSQTNTWQSASTT